MLSLGNQTLVNRTGEQGDAVPAYLITEVLASHADPLGAGGTQGNYAPLTQVIEEGTNQGKTR